MRTTDAQDGTDQESVQPCQHRRTADAREGADREPVQPRPYRRTADAQDDTDRGSVQPRSCMRTTDAQDGTDRDSVQPRLYMRTTDAQEGTDRDSVQPRPYMRTTDAQDDTDQDSSSTVSTSAKVCKRRRRGITRIRIRLILPIRGSTTQRRTRGLVAIKSTSLLRLTVRPHHTSHTSLYPRAVFSRYCDGQDLRSLWQDSRR